MSVYILQRKQVLPIPLEQAWDFFSSPLNLQKMTPSYMRFKITSPLPDAMYAGQIITYTVSPVMGIPLFWMTEITQVQEGKFFIDEQRFGPYALWHHQHHFKTVEGGVEMTDLVHYKLPLGILGRVAHWLFVSKQLKGIFAFRQAQLERQFGGIQVEKTAV